MKQKLHFFSGNLPMLWYLSKSFFNEILIQPPGEPREQHLYEVQHLIAIDIIKHHTFSVILQYFLSISFL